MTNRRLVQKRVMGEGLRQGMMNGAENWNWWAELGGKIGLGPQSVMRKDI